MSEPAVQLETRDVPMLDVRAAPQADTWDEEARTCTFVASTGARGLRRRLWGENYYEELEISPSAIRMDRLNNGAPFLNTHNSYSVENVLGVIDRAWIEDDQLMISVRFSKRESIEPVVQDIRDGVLPSVSVGYQVWEYDKTERQGELDIYRAVDWEPMEVSCVPIAFDDDAKVRSAEVKTSQAKITTRAAGPTTDGGADMPTEKEERKEAPATTEQPDNITTGLTQEDVARSAQESADNAIVAERKRASDIQSAVRSAKLPPEFAEELVRDGVSIDDARAKIIDKWAEADDSEETRGIRTSVDHEIVTKMRDGIVNALAHRADPSVTLAEGSQEFAYMSLLRMSEELLQREGVSTRGMSKRELATRALSTSDLPLIAGSLMNRSLLQGYESSPRTFMGVFRQASASDFRDINRARLSGAPMLEEVKENGEFKHGKLTDEKETYSLATYGKILPFTRQMIINDDLDALTRIPRLFGRAAADLESDIVWGVVTANDAMGDGTNLFHASHGNLGTAGAPSETTLDEMEQKFLAQTGLEGRLINVAPSWLIVGPKHKVAAKKLLTSVTPDSSSNVNVFQNAMDLVVEARLTGDAWYAAADHNQVDTIEYCYLEGEQGVYIETQQGFDIDGIQIKARHDFAAKAIDHRGLFKNAGA